MSTQNRSKGSGADNSVVILPSALFHIGQTQREQDLLNLPPPSCSSNPGAKELFELRTKQAMGMQAGFGARNTASAVSARKADTAASSSGNTAAK
mmetsp:Transcript_27863/g.64739  ORF Transcript_27863/g.64739 Transcript_27863/m.64739 type:complete len:95 (-) Transcript_27863:106-390(-)